MNEITWCLPFSDGLISLSIIHSILTIIIFHGQVKNYSDNIRYFQISISNSWHHITKKLVFNFHPIIDINLDKTDRLHALTSRLEGFFKCTQNENGIMVEREENLAFFKSTLKRQLPDMLLEKSF